MEWKWKVSHNFLSFHTCDVQFHAHAFFWCWDRRQQEQHLLGDRISFLTLIGSFHLDHYRLRSILCSPNKRQAAQPGFQPLFCRKLFWDAASEHEIFCLDGIWFRFSWHLVITVYSSSNPGIVVFGFAALCFIPPQCHLTWEGTQAFLFADVLVRDWSGWKETLGFASTISAVIFLTSLGCPTAGARRVGSFWWGARTVCATHHLLLACTSPSQGWRFGSLTFLETAAVRTIRQGARRIWPGSSSISVLTFLFSSTFLVPPVVHSHTHVCSFFWV